MNHRLVTSIPHFVRVSRRARRAVAALADDVTIEPGTTVVQQGSYARDLYLVVDGSADVLADGARVATLGPGDVFGERAVHGTPSRTATVVASTTLRLLVASGRDAASLVDYVPALAPRAAGAAA